jgi:hypothetical protein
VILSRESDLADGSCITHHSTTMHIFTGGHTENSSSPPMCVLAGKFFLGTKSPKQLELACRAALEEADNWAVAQSVQATVRPLALLLLPE